MNGLQLRTEAAQLLGTTKREVEWWEQTGVLGSKDRDDPRYSTERLFRAATIKELRTRGVTLPQIRKHLTHIFREPLGEHLAVFYSRERGAMVPTAFVWFLAEKEALRALQRHDGAGLIVPRKAIERRRRGFAN
jgi:DNA-binding transcriptional MerR regulator